MSRKRGGFSGGPMGGNTPSNQAGLMRQIQKMQEEMEAAQAALDVETLEVTAGGGAVKIVINGHQKVQSITIQPDAIDTSDEEWLTDLQDVLVAAINQAVEQSQVYASEKMEGLTGGLQSMLPPGLGLF